MTVPEAYGGSAAGDFAHILGVEALAYAGCPAWWPVAFNNSLPQTICRFGNEAQKQQYVKPGLTGEHLFSIQFAEPHTGSDPAALNTKALEAAACKIAVQPLMSEAIATSFRLHGGYGYTKDYKIERLYRAQPGNVVISVSLEINKAIIGASLVRWSICSHGVSSADTAGILPEP